MSKSRDRLLAAAVALLEANGHTGDIVGDLAFLEVADIVIADVQTRARHSAAEDEK